MLDAPSVGAAALGTQTGAESTPQPPAPAARRRPSDFQPGYGGADTEPSRPAARSPREAREASGEDPSRFERKLGGEAGGDPQSDDGLRIDDGQESAAESDVGTEEAERQALFEKLGESLAKGVLKASDLPKGIKIEWTMPGGETLSATPEQLVKLAQGNMRQSDYTRKLIDAQRVQADASSLIRLEGQRRQEWRDPSRLMNGLAQMGLEEAFIAAVDMHVQNELRFRSLPPEKKAQIQYERRAALMQQQYEQRMQAMEQRMQQAGQPDLQAATDRIYQQIHPVMETAFKRLGVPPGNAFAQQEFVKALEIRHAMSGGGEVTQDMIEGAAESVADLFEEKRAALRLANEAAARAAGGGRALPPRRMAGAPGQTVSTNGKRSRPSDFGSRFNHTGF